MSYYGVKLGPFTIVKLPKGWKNTDGLKYPLSIRLTNGVEMTFDRYEEHHAFIQSIFKLK